MPPLLSDLAARVDSLKSKARESRSLRSLLATVRLGVAGVVVLAMLVVGAVLAFAGVGLAREVALNLALNGLTALALAGLGYLYFSSWTRTRVTKRMLEVGLAAPEELFTSQPLPFAASSVGRDELIREIATDLTTFRAGPQIIVGETGSGKTSLLLGLARYLAERGVVPIPVSLRGETSPDFAELARKRFLDYVDPYARSPSEAERVWRSLCLRKEVVLLADDLDGAEVDVGHEPSTATRVALARLRDRGLSALLTSRREGVPPEFEKSAIELDQCGIELDEAVNHVLQQAGKHERGERQSVARDVVRKVVDAGRLQENPFYLGIAAELLGTEERVPKGASNKEQGRLTLLEALERSLPEHAWRKPHSVRVAVLDKYRAGLHEATLAADSRVPEPDRGKVLVTLEWISAIRLVSNEAQLLKHAGIKRPSKDRERAAVYAGERLGLVEIVSTKGAYQFRHEALKAYFASRVLRTNSDLRNVVIKLEPQSPVVQLALVLAAAKEGPRFARETCTKLLNSTRRLAPDARLLVLSAGAEIVHAAGGDRLADIADKIASECERLVEPGGRLAKMAAVRQLCSLPGKGHLHTLWRYCKDEDYAVRWTAATAIADEGGAAYRTLRDTFNKHLKTAEDLVARGEKRDDWHDDVLPLKHLGWVLPALQTSARNQGDGETADDVERDLQRLLNLEGGPGSKEGSGNKSSRLTEQRGLEASVSQGFKVDALRHPHAPVDERALELLKGAEFWYSRINLVHAIAVRAHGREGGDRRAVSEIEKLKKTDQHPFVKAAATLSLRVSKDRSRGAPAQHASAPHSRHIWDDEGEVVARRPHGLSDEASQLVGDIAMLLNMNETGNERQRETFGTKSYLPYCFAKSRDRREILGDHAACPDECDFGLCPYRLSPGRRSAHRELSRAFCRQQRLLAKARVAARYWDSPIRQPALTSFWAWLESRARI